MGLKLISAGPYPCPTRMRYAWGVAGAGCANGANIGRNRETVVVAVIGLGTYGVCREFECAFRFKRPSMSRIMTATSGL